MIRKYIIPMALFAISTSCVEDEGNYNYTPINDVSITDGMESYYSKLAYLDRLQISPVLEGSVYGDDMSRYIYEWHICSGVTGDGPHHEHTVISREKDLDWLIEAKPNTYTIYFIIKDTETNIEKAFATSLDVKNAFSTGFLLFGDKDGTSSVGMDMITMPPQRDTTLVADIFDNSIGLTGARKLYYSGSYMSEPGQIMFAMTDDTSWHLSSLQDSDPFAPIETFASMGMIECEYDLKSPMRLVDAFPQGKVPYYSSVLPNCSSSARFYITEDAVFGGGSLNGAFYAQPYNRYSTDAVKLFNFYPYIFYNYANLGANRMQPMGFLYDTDNDRFARMYSGYVATGLCYEIADIAGDAWSYDCKSENRKLVYGESVPGRSGLSCMIMKDNNDQYFIYTIDFYYGLNYNGTFKSTPTKRLFPVDLATAKDLDKASHYAFSPTRYTMMYAVGNILYYYDFANGRMNKLELNGEITFLEYDFDSAARSTDLIIATWNDNTHKGMVKKFDVSDDVNVMDITPRDGEEWETNLKVKDIQWFQN